MTSKQRRNILRSEVGDALARVASEIENLERVRLQRKGSGHLVAACSLLRGAADRLSIVLDQLDLEDGSTF